MIFKVSPGSLHGSVSAPPSKSLTHRAFFAAALSSGESRIQDPLASEDTDSTLQACERLGAGVSAGVGEVEFSGVGGRPVNPGSVDCRNSGTTFRILCAISALCPGKVALTGDASLQKRPIGPMLCALGELGVKSTSNQGFPPVTIEGPLHGGEARIPGDISSQYLSGILMAAPLAGGDTRLILTSELKSRPYVDLTLDVLSAFGVSAREEDESFYIPSGQEYAARDYRVEGDFSSAAFVLAAGALTDSDVSVQNLLKDSRQGDAAFISILEEMGANVVRGEDKVHVVGGNPLRGIEVDMSQTPDLVPITAVLCSLAAGESRITGAEHLRYKESDRLKALEAELSRMGAKIQETKDGLAITGVSSLTGGRVSGWGDHRVAMALSVAALRAEKPTLIGDAESVSISYPGFAEEMTSLGMNIEKLP